MWMFPVVANCLYISISIHLFVKCFFFKKKKQPSQQAPTSHVDRDVAYSM